MKSVFLQDANQSNYSFQKTSPIPKTIKARWKERVAYHDLEWWRQYFTLITESKWMTEKSHQNLGWVCLPTNLGKVLDLTYHDDGVKGSYPLLGIESSKPGDLFDNDDVSLATWYAAIDGSHRVFVKFRQRRDVGFENESGEEQPLIPIREFLKIYKLEIRG